MSFEHWIDLPNGDHRCPNHDQTFARNEVCEICSVEPEEMPTGADGEPSRYEQRLLVIEAGLDSTRKFLDRVARELWGGTPLERNTAIKAFDTALKHTNALTELTEKRLRRERIDSHKRAALQMAGIRGHN